MLSPRGGSENDDSCFPSEMAGFWVEGGSHLSILVSESERSWRMVGKEGRQSGEECLQHETGFVSACTDKSNNKMMSA